MSFIRETVNRSMDLWNACLEHPFLIELHEGRLPEEKFTNYIVQDSIYLREYARVLGLGLLRSETSRDIRMFYSQLGFVNEKESAARLHWLHSHGSSEEEADRTPPLPACRDYTRFMLGEAASGGIPEIMMAVLPCMLSYYYLFDKLLQKYPEARSLPYWYVIEDYSRESYHTACDHLGTYTESICHSLSEPHKARLADIFRTSSAHELAFWDMAYA